MKWKKRLAEIQRLKAKHGTDRSLAHVFPDLSVDNRASSTSNRMDTPPALKKEALVAILGSDFVISHLHKSGYQVFHKSDLPNLGRKI